VATREVSISVTMMMSLTHFLSFALHRFTVLSSSKGNNDGKGNGEGNKKKSKKGKAEWLWWPG
jgi:hypothetical protein